METVRPSHVTASEDLRFSLSPAVVAGVGRDIFEYVVGDTETVRSNRAGDSLRARHHLFVVSAATAALCGFASCSVDESGLTSSLTGGGGSFVGDSGSGIGGQGPGVGGNGAGGTIGIGGAGGAGAGGTGMGGTGSGGNGAGGTAGTGMGGTAVGGSGAGGTGVGGAGVGGHIVDAGPDVRDAIVDVPIVDVGPDLPVCDTAHGQHRCGDTCVLNSSIANCGPTSCTPCPVPANSVASCDGTSCGFVCNVGFVPVNGACVRTCDMNCAIAATKVTLPGGRFTGTTTGTSANAGSCGGASAPEAVFQLVLTQQSDVFVTTHGSKFDTVIYMRNGCCGTEIACNNDMDGRTTSMFNALGVAAGTYDIFVDGAGSTGGAFTVDIYTSPTSANPGESCGRPTRITTAPIIGNTTGYRDDYHAAEPTCGRDDGGLDVVYYFVLDQTTTISFDTCTNTCIDSILYLRDVCTAPTAMADVACNDDACSADSTCFPQSSSQSKVQAQLGPGVHYVVLDTLINPQPAPNTGLFTISPNNVPP
jgi:hypothetical protein